MTKAEAQKILDRLIEKLNYFRTEEAITAYAPYKFDLRQRIKDLDKQVEKLKNILANAKAETIEFQAFEEFEKYLSKQIQPEDFIRLSGNFIQNSKNIVTGNTFGDISGGFHLGDTTIISPKNNESQGSN